MRSVLPSLVLFSAAGLLISCGSTDKECFDDRSCDSGQRCVIQNVGEVGLCGPCDATETPYNGIDDDCNPRTRDLDLDQDGQNSVDSPVAPGLDCDDDDDQVMSGADEICGDAKDNDCDGEVDERDCADLAPPTLRFLSPMNGDVVSGQVALRMQVDDDVGAVLLKVYANGQELSSITLEPSPSRTEEVSLDTVTIPDGPVSLTIEATDLKGSTARAQIVVQVDNRTPPDVEINSPVADGYYGGYLTATASIADASRIATVAVELDGQTLSTLTAPPWSLRVETSSLAEGQHSLGFRAIDSQNNSTTSSVSFWVDNSGPFVTFTAPTAGATVSGLVMGTVTATDASGIRSLSAEGASGTSPLAFSVDTGLLVNGAITFTAVAEDSAIVDDGTAAGNMGQAMVTVDVDNIDPTPSVTFVTPLSDWGVLGITPMQVDVVSLVGNAMSSVDFSVEGLAAGSALMPPYSTSYDFSTHTGTVAVTVVATDTMGNTGQASIVVEVVPLPNFRVAPKMAFAGTVGTAKFTVGDVSGDGVLDVIAGGSSVQVFTGTIAADGNWAAMAPASVGGMGIVDVRLADTNNDGVDDIIALRATGFDVFIAQGAGAFGPATSYVTPQGGMRAFEVADIDGDMDADVVIVGGATTGVVGYSYVQDNSGNYVFDELLGGGSGVSDVALADIDADGDTDVIVGRTTTSVLTIFLNGGPTSMQRYGAGRDTATAAPPESVEVADMNGDTLLDVVVRVGPDVQILPVLSTSPFSIVASANTVGNAGGAQSVALGQVVGNSLTDMVVATPGGNTFEVIQGGAASNTGFQTDEIYVAGNTFSNVILADLDNDGQLDVLGTTPTDNSLVWARNLGNGKFNATINVNTPTLPDVNNVRVQLIPTALATGNVAGSAAVDLVVNYIPPQFPALMVVYERAGTGLNLFDAQVPPPSILNPTLLAVGGTSGLTPYDAIVVGHSGPVQSVMGVAQPTARFYLPLGTANNYLVGDRIIGYASEVEIGDVDNDGISDAVFSIDAPPGFNDGAAISALNFSTFYSAPYGGLGPNSIAIGNLDTDPMGLVDFAIANNVTENISVQLWNGSGFTDTQFNAPTGLGAITTGLVNDDIYLDLVGVSATGIFVMEGDPNFGFRTPQTFPAGASPTKLVGGDFNGDGLFDVMTLNSGDVASLMLARPQGGFFAPIAFGTGAGPVDFVSVDFDEDGRLDIIAIQDGVPSILLLTNNSDTL